jgi:HAD superfamily hydrolase (TIGR01549 family)
MPKQPYHAIIFDMDGTITLPVLDFRIIRKEIGLPEGDIAKEIAKLPEPERTRAWRIIDDHEREAEEQQELQAGAKALLNRCRESGMRIGLITRNVQRSVDTLCRKFDLTFDHVITREFPHLKPHPAPILHMLESWGIAPDRALMVGDYIHDIECGRAAGTHTCYYHNPGRSDFGAGASFTVHSMTELAQHLWPH